MRPLTTSEISTLQQQHCSCNDWLQIEVAEKFSTQYICNVHFSGHISLGVFEKSIELPSGMQQHAGIYNATLHNCIVEDNVLISNINNYIANYHLQHDCYVENIDLLAVEGISAFGNGTEVNVLNEAGGREVKIFDQLSSHVAYILALYRHRPLLIEKLNQLIDHYTESVSSALGTIGAHAKITNSGTIKNVRIGAFACIENVTELYNGTINSNEIDSTYVGTGVIARHFIIGAGSKVYDYALLDKSYIGESCEIGKQYSATDSLFFCNSQLLHGEAAAVFGGPYTTTHHKSTLLIGCMFSFYNAGSGTNQSNHMYKLGPVHQGVFERGVKTGSDSYVMLEAKAGAYSLILGHHEQHFDTTDLPFSYIMADGSRSSLIPAVNFQTVGTQRDVQKWPKRDGRKGENQLEYIIFDLLNPYIIQRVKNGIGILKKFEEKTSESHLYKSIRIKDIFVSKGIQIYQSAVVCYLGKLLAKKLSNTSFNLQNLKPETTFGKTEWVDLSGLIIPKDLLEENLSDIENGRFRNIDAINAFFSNVYDDYSFYEWNYACHLLEEQIGKSIQEIQKSDVVALLELYKKTLHDLTNAIVADAEKEFNPASMVSFGIYGDKETQQMDFQNVRGTHETNSFVVDVKVKNEVAVVELDEIIKKL